MEAIHIFIFCITLFLFLLRTLFKKSHTKNLPPGPTGFPILGNLHQLGNHPHVTLHNMAKQFGPLMTLNLGSITTIVASSPDNTKEILRTHDQTFSNRFVPDSVASQPHPEGTLAWVPGDHRWRNRRRICSTQMFTAQRLDLLQHFRHRNVHQLLAHIKKHSDAGTEVDIGSLGFATTLNLISNTIFSVDIVDPDFKTAQEFKELVWRIMMDAGKPNLSDYFPMLKRFDLQGVRRHVQVSYVRLHEIFDDIIGKRLKERENDKTKRYGDFLDALLDQCQEDGSDFSLDTIKPLILVRDSFLDLYL
jgi:cytochrome P450|uniref:Cytochrome P450 n=1 Tax=Fagus sylvatica TaxID=28930 RepID=A0A2N9HQ24_FAGSY